MTNARLDPPVPKDEHVRRRLVAQGRKDTAPELNIRRELHRRGLRYRVGLRVPGMPRRTIDVAFTKAKVAVFVDGCFWHRCPDHHVPAKHNATWWDAKLERNVERDAETTRVLEDLGWTVIRLWEHESAAPAADTVEAAVRSDRRPPVR